MTIKTKKRTQDWLAWFDGEANKWECGKTEAEAIGNLVINRGENHDIEIEEV